MKKIIVFYLLLFMCSFCHAQTFTVERVIDGDIIKLTNGKRVRLIGIDCPESKPNKKAQRDSQRTGKDVETINKMGQEATEFVRRMIEGYPIRLEFDVQERDKYGRLLAYVHILDKAKFWHYAPGHSPYVVDQNNKHLTKVQEIYEEGVEPAFFLNAIIMQFGYAKPMTQGYRKIAIRNWG